MTKSKTLKNTKSTKEKSLAATEPLFIHLDADIEHYFRAIGNDWQSRANNVLRAAISMHKHLSP